MRLELVGGRHGQGQAGESHPGSSGHDQDAAAGAGQGPGAGDHRGEGDLVGQLNEAERLVAGVRQRLQALTEQAAALRERLSGGSRGESAGSTPSSV